MDLNEDLGRKRKQEEDPNGPAKVSRVEGEVSEGCLEVSLKGLLDGASNFSASLRPRMARSNEFCDLVLIVGGQRHLCNALVLSSMSPVFKAMLAQHWKHTKEITLGEEDIVAPHFSSFLDCLYGHEINYNGQNIIPFIMLSHKYQIHVLLSSLCHSLINLMNTSNTTMIWTLSKKYDLKLDEKIMVFSTKNFEDLSVTTLDMDYWETLFKKSGMRVRNEYYIFKKVKDLWGCHKEHINLDQLKRLLNCIYWQNIHPIDIITKVLHSEMASFIPSETIIKMSSLNIYKLLDVKILDNKRTYLDTIHEAKTICIPAIIPDASPKFLSSFGTLADVSIAVVDNDIVFVVKAPPQTHAKIEILNVLQNKLIGSSKETRANDYVFVEFLKKLKASQLFNPESGYLSEDGSFTFVLSIWKIT